MPLFKFKSARSASGGEPFRFVDPGPLIDADLELIRPEARWVDEVLAACRHPQSLQEEPSLGQTTRNHLLEFLAACPRGLQKAEPDSGIVPTYHFWMRDHRPAAPLTIAGGIGLRIGRTPDLELYFGHVGYHVYPPSRGQHFAARACHLLAPLAAAHGISPLWITCNPDNIASRRTCEYLGAALVDTVPVPTDHPLYQRGERMKCRYRLDI